MGVKIPAAFEDSTGTIQRLTGEVELLVAATPGEVLTANNPANTASFVAGSSVSYVTVNAGAPSPLTTYVTPLFFDSTGTTGGLYAWTGTTYHLVGLATS